MAICYEKLVANKRLLAAAAAVFFLSTYLLSCGRAESLAAVLQVWKLGPPAAAPAAAAAGAERDTFVPQSDADVWHCGEFKTGPVGGSPRRPFEGWVAANASDEEVLCAAHDAAKRPMAAGAPRVAFLFMVLGDVPLEPVWRAFFAGHEGRYSLYVHPHNADHTYPRTSLFHGRKVPSKPLDRFEISQPEGIRRVLAYALLDDAAPNAWFTLQSETSIPVRPFPYVHDYLTRSCVSFVEAFYAWEWWRTQWVDGGGGPPPLPDDQMRKGEVWSTVHRRHAGLIVGDVYVFTKFKLAWRPGALSCEVYVPTLMHVADSEGIANRSVTYVDWRVHGSHPRLYTAADDVAALVRHVQAQRQNVDGMYKDTHVLGHDDEASCVYNGVADSPCWLFARKFAGGADDVCALLAARSVLGY